MKELVLTRVYNAVATLALVDYDAYTVSTKLVKLTQSDQVIGTVDDLGEELEKLITAGKLRLYRTRSNLSSRYDAWLAYEPQRGCLVVHSDGTCECLPMAEYMSRIVADTMRGSDEGYNPKYLGEPVKSFYETVKAIEKKHNSTIKDSDVRDEIANTTGVWVDYGYDAHPSYNSKEYYAINCFGATLDKISLVGDSDNLLITVQGQGICELCVDAPTLVRISARKALTLERVKLSQRIKELEITVNTNIENSYPELITDAATCELSRLKGYKKSDADLSMFKNLNFFDLCWCMPDNKLTPINLKLPSVAETEFTHCFKNVAIQGLLPYTSVGGVLDITGITLITSSFLNFNGVGFIRGTVGGLVQDSFISNEFDGKFDVTVENLMSSFGYKVKKNNTFTSSNSVEIPAKYTPEGTINVAFRRGMRDFRVGYIPNNVEMSFWKQTQVITYDEPVLSKLSMDLNETTTFVVNTPLRECAVNAGYLRDSKVKYIAPVFNAAVTKLTRGDFPYANVTHYADKCFSANYFKSTHLCVLQEGLNTIGQRSFYDTTGIDYLVIPKSCYSIGAAAFSEMKSSTGDLTTICVYKDSAAHTWSKGKKLKIKVIESLDEIPKKTSKETESDFLSAFVETPVWADASRPFVAKVLTLDTIDILERIPVVVTLTPELAKFFTDTYKDFNKIKTDSKGNETRTDVAAPGTETPSATGYISRAALQAAALNALHGSCTDLLKPEVLNEYVWDVKIVHEVTRWIGTPKVSSYYGGAGRLTLYLRGDEVLYVGCGDLMDTRGMEGQKGVWQIPQNVLSSPNLIGPDVEGRMVIYSSWLKYYVQAQVHGDNFTGEALLNLKEFIHKSMVLVGNLESTASGRVTVTTRLVYDVGNNKLYKFTSSDSRRYSHNKAADLGTYRGEMDIAEYHKLERIELAEKACLDICNINVGRVEEAPPSYELEFCRTHPKFDLLGAQPQTESFIHLLSSSGLVKKTTQGVLNNRITYQVYNHLADGTKVVSGKTPSGCTYLLGITYKEKFYGFEAGFDMLDFALKTDERIPRDMPYSNPHGGYFTVVRARDLFVVTPTPKSSDYGNDVLRKGIFIGLDFTSGKLVMAMSDSDYYGVICSFESAKDAREFYTEFGCKFFAPPEDFFSKSMRSTVYMHHAEVYNREIPHVLDIHPHNGDARFANSLMVLGGKQPVDRHSMTRDIYNNTILKYCRI